MTYPGLKLKVLPERYGIYCLHPDSEIPKELLFAKIVSITRTSKELTLVCEEGKISEYEQKEVGWRCLKVDSSFNFDAIGVIASIAAPLVDIGVSIYVVSTFDTDYILLKDDRLKESVECLTRKNHQIE